MDTRLERQFRSLGVPSVTRDRASLLALLPPDFPPEAAERLTDSALAEVFVYLARKGVIRVPTRHTCRLYLDRESMLTIAAAHLAAGLKNGDRAIWILPSWLTNAEAAAALKAAAGTVKAGSALLKREEEWYDDFEATMRRWLDAEQRALADGYNGITITGDGTFAAGTPEALDYEQRVGEGFAGRRVNALCTYQSDAVDAALLRRLQARHHDLTGV